MTTSVVLSAYNGEERIREQLDSLLAQTKQPDEVLILDDGSTDHTVEVVSAFIREHALTSWRVLANENNLGWKKSFMKGLSLAKGELLFPCDQDDIWMDDKIEGMEELMRSHQEIGVLVGNPVPFREEKETLQTGSLRAMIGGILDKRMEKKEASKNTGTLTKAAFDEGFIRRPPGCVMAVRKSFFEEIKDYWEEGMPHDGLLSYFPRIKGRLYFWDKDVILWRKHNDSSSRGKRNREDRLLEIYQDRRNFKALYRYAKAEGIEEEKLLFLRKAGTWNRTRWELVKKGELLRLMPLLHLRKFYTQGRRMITDFRYGMTPFIRAVKGPFEKSVKK